MTIKDHSNGSESSMLHATGQTITAEGHIPKVRKQYTITKQRERWTEEEHKKFLEALKLYGRAWRKIEEHVGSKNAVQIRSHAQKFFSKVVRESNNTNSGSIKPMEIPPPRPKRKPMHPYPCKLVIPVNKDMTLQEQSARSTSPNSSVDQEHQSPTSVLSAFASEALQFEDSSTPDGSSSPVSQDDAMAEEEPASVKLEMSPNTSAFTNGSSLEATSPKTLKLFGQTMFVEDPVKTAASSDPQPMEVGPSAPVPLRASCGAMLFPFIQINSINSTKESAEDKETHKEGFLFGLTVGLINAASNCHTNQENGTQIHEHSLESTAIQQSVAPVSQSRLRTNLKRTNSEKYTRAFVPYKRSLSEKGTQFSTITDDEDNDLQRTRLCF